MKKQLTILGYVVLSAILFGIITILPLGTGLIIVLALIGLIFKKYRTLSSGLLVGITLLFLVYLIGFYTKAHVVREFDNGGTWIPERNISTAFGWFLMYSSYLVAALFGYDSNTIYGQNTSTTLLFIGTLVTVTLVMSGVPLLRLVMSVVRKCRIKKLDMKPGV